jgi:hypothetical protein
MTHTLITHNPVLSILAHHQIRVVRHPQSMVNYAATSISSVIICIQLAAMKIHLSFFTLFCFKLVASLHQDATSHLRTAIDMTVDTPVQAKCKKVHDQRDLAAGALTGLVLYDTSTKTNITLTNNLTIVSADPKYTVVALLSATAGIESVRFRQVQAGKSTVYKKVENTFFYTLCGNNGNNMTTCSFLKYGTHTVTATAFSQHNANGKQVGPAVTIAFTIAPPPPSKSPTKAPTMAPTKFPTKAPTKIPTKAPVRTSWSLQSDSVVGLVLYISYSWSSSDFYDCVYFLGEVQGFGCPAKASPYISFGGGASGFSHDFSVNLGKAFADSKWSNSTNVQLAAGYTMQDMPMTVTVTMSTKALGTYRDDSNTISFVVAPAFRVPGGATPPLATSTVVIGTGESVTITVTSLI